MKKIIVLLLALMLMFMFGCNKKQDAELNGETPLQSENLEASNGSSTDNDTIDPEDNQFENNHPENNQPEDNPPENNQPEDNPPENNQPENNPPENNQPENNPPENNQPENNGSENNQPENNGQNTPTHSHSFNAIVTLPTCTAGGYTTYTCSECSYTYTDNNTPATGHTEVNIPGREATCTSTGLTEGKQCSVCNLITVAQQTVATKSHNYSSTVTSPTCTAGGYTTYTCSECSHTYTGNNTSATGHTPGSAATCTSAQTCTVCRVTITAAYGHSWIDATTEAPKTCTTCGATEGEKLPSQNTTLPTLYVNYINVGQGDSILIKAGDCDILIDAGTANYGSTVSSYLASKGVDDIELMINTHPDSDHCGGLTQVLKDYAVEQVWISKDTSKTTSAYTNFIAAVGNEGLSAKKPNAGTVFTYEYLTITVIYSAVGSDSNNSSIVVMLEYGSFKFLFTGDIGKEAEDVILSSGADISCDVLKVGHHGSAGSSTASFLSATGAEYGIICVGDNSYGHPTSTALNNLSNAGISVYRTDLNGNVVFSTNGVTLYLPNGSSDSSGSGTGSTGGATGGATGGTTGTTEYFIGNTETKVFHLPTCSNLPAASKQNLMYNYAWIVNIAGYTPCGRCLKDYNGGTGTSYIANTESKVYHMSTCSYLPAASKQQVIYSTSGYTPCGHCIKGNTTSYIANTESKVYHLSTCSYLPAASKQEVIYSTSGYTPCGHCIK